MLLIAFGVVVCALGEANLVYKGLAQQLVALLFEVRSGRPAGSGTGCATALHGYEGAAAEVARDSAAAADATPCPDICAPCRRRPGPPCARPCLQAARLTLVQILINARGLAMNPLQSLYYVSPSCLVCLMVPFRETQVAAAHGRRGRLISLSS